MLILIYLVIFIILLGYCIKTFDKNKYYFMPFGAPSPEYYYPEWHASNHVEINFQGDRLFGYTSKPLLDIKPSNIVILYFHGNAGNIYFRIPHFKTMINKLNNNDDFNNKNDKKEYVLIAFDYRGYGLSTGVPTTEGILEDGLQMVKWCKTNYPNNKIVYYGESIGTSILAYVAQFTKPHGIILKSPFSSMATLVADMFHIPARITQYFIHNDFLTEKWLASIDHNKIPLLIMYPLTGLDSQSQLCG